MQQIQLGLQLFSKHYSKYCGAKQQHCLNRSTADCKGACTSLHENADQAIGHTASIWTCAKQAVLFHLTGPSCYADKAYGHWQHMLCQLRRRISVNRACVWECGSSIISTQAVHVVQVDSMATRCCLCAGMAR